MIVVEHDEDMIRAADHVIDMGPGAGIHGGRVMAQGTLRGGGGQRPSRSPGQYLSGAQEDRGAGKRRTPWLPVRRQAGVDEEQEGLALSAQRRGGTARGARGGTPGIAADRCRKSA